MYWQEQTISGRYVYEYEHDGSNYTGWYRCKDGQLADGRHPEWNYKTHQIRYTVNGCVVDGPFPMEERRD